MILLMMVDTPEEKRKFVILYENYRYLMLKVAVDILHDYQLAEDAVQETFLKVIRYFPRYKNKGKFRAFLYKVASNTCVDTWRQSREMHLTEQIEYQEAGFAHSESEEGFRQIVEMLPEDQREVIYLRFAHDLTLRETAKVLGIPMRTVQSRQRAGLKKIEEKIGKEEAR